MSNNNRINNIILKPHRKNRQFVRMQNLEKKHFFVEKVVLTNVNFSLFKKIATKTKK